MDKPTKLQVMRLWREWRSLAIFLVVMVMFRSAVADWNTVPTGSMKPTILVGDRVVVNKIAYDLKVPLTTWHLAAWANPQQGEIITFYSPLDERLLIKRVVGLPGDVVTLSNNTLEINGMVARYAPLPAEAYNHLAVDQSSHLLFTESIAGVVHPVMMIPYAPTGYNSFGPITIPDHHYLVLGDNRDNSADYRKIGFVHRNRITGRAHTVAFSIDFDHWFMPRLDRFVTPLP